MGQGTSKIVIRIANAEDEAALWSWYQDPYRPILFQNSSVLSREQHKDWFRRVRKSSSEILMLGILDTIRCGVVCAKEREPGIFIAHLYIKSTYMKRGLALELLKTASDFLGRSRELKSVSLQIPGLGYAALARSLTPSDMELTQVDASLQWITGGPA